MVKGFGYSTHTARKKHVCNLCGGLINEGERYDSEFCVDDGLAYTFKAHEKCNYIASEIYEYVDPYDGMDKTGFLEGCSEISEIFVCPYCENRENCRESFCLDKMFDFLKKYRLYVAERKGNNKIWKVTENVMPF